MTWPAESLSLTPAYPSALKSSRTASAGSFAPRAAAELERKRAEDALREREHLANARGGDCAYVAELVDRRRARLRRQLEITSVLVQPPL